MLAVKEFVFSSVSLEEWAESESGIRGESMVCSGGITMLRWKLANAAWHLKMVASIKQWWRGVAVGGREEFWKHGPCSV